MSIAGDPELAKRLADVRALIAAEAQACGRAAEEIELIAVAKTQPAEAVEAALASGQAIFGENRVQEAKSKYPALKAAHPRLRLHLIGPLQTNKVRDALGLFDVVQTLDRAKLAHALARELAREGSGPGPSLFVQVNTGEEPQKAGVGPEQADALIALCREELGLKVEGLMCIPPLDEESALHFALLREIARRNDLAKLSMGMSDDYQTAIRFGATHVRVGTAIFGPRRPPPPA